MYILRPLAEIGVFAMSAQLSSGSGGSAAGSSPSAAAAPTAGAAGACSPTRLKASGGEVRPTGLMSQKHPATSRITSRLLLSGSRRTALNLLAPRWSRPVSSSLPSAFPGNKTSTQRWSSLPSFFVGWGSSPRRSLRTPQSLLRTCAAC